MKSITKTYTITYGKDTASGLTEEQIAGLQCIYNKTDKSYCYGPSSGNGISEWNIGKPGENNGLRFCTGDGSLAPGTITPLSGSNAGTKTFVFYYI